MGYGSTPAITYLRLGACSHRLEQGLGPSGITPNPTKRGEKVRRHLPARPTQTMRILLASALVATPLIAGNIQTQGQNYNYQYSQMGNIGQGSIYGSDGYTGTLSQSQIGNFVNTTYSDDDGTTSCQTSTIGNFINTSCN